jgi:hypothetical protein
VKHWAHDLIGLRDVGQCWGLVQTALRIRYGDELPDVLAAQDTADAIRQAAREFGWRLAEFPMRDGDVVTMRSSHRRRHVALAVEADGVVECLHWNGGMVVFERLSTMRERFCDFQLWRKTP